jgi:hypothetical protein
MIKRRNRQALRNEIVYTERMTIIPPGDGSIHLPKEKQRFSEFSCAAKQSQELFIYIN